MTETLTPRARMAVPAWGWWTGFAAVVAIGLWLSRLAYREGLPDFFVYGEVDKVVHFTMGGLLAFFLDGALKRRAAFEVLGLVVPAAAIIILVPAGIEEYLQRYADYRTSSWFDFLADVAGVVVFIPLSRRVAQ